MALGGGDEPACEVFRVDVVRGVSGEQYDVFERCFERWRGGERGQTVEECIGVFSHPYFGVCAGWGELSVFDSVFDVVDVFAVDAGLGAAVLVVGAGAGGCGFIRGSA